MIRVQHLSYQYENEEGQGPLALKDVSFEVQKGEWVAIVGHNGSGKSTLAKLLDGLLIAKEGTIVIDGLQLGPDTLWDVRKKIGMVFQNPDNQFVGSTVQDDVAFGLENQAMPREDMLVRVESALEKVGMSAFKDKEPARLSGGQKQRVAIASVLALAPAIMILDESTAMLDPKGRRQIVDVIKQLKQETDLTVVSITHDVEEASLADRILVMNQGSLVFEGRPGDLFSQLDKMQDFGLDLPLSETVRRALLAAGFPLPDRYMTQEELEDWICQFALNK